ncbi:DUF1543 domain-containing protein [Rheinheimera sediminis]|uniref:DUF1543 domain-containing protein n=1 Tax=Rheinheimera sp. YQF-1 TaxID=2499626 RepID=UPI000FDC0CE4|nr:DUF1543 domain-containing protein [Rheinheimera sp. YQF-1]RVT47399.1 DUF1543 domain-containing protein [Rheinheimera sp. YQF-1]
MLFVVMLGGKHPKAKIEVHDVVFVTGSCIEDCYPELRQQWFGTSEGMHIDSWMQVDGIEGYQVRFSEQAPAADELRLFFINLGGYTPGTFGEDHHYLLVTAKDKAQAKQKGKMHLPKSWDKPHTDAVVDVDDCIAIDQIDGRYVRLVQGHYKETVHRSDYIVLA